MKLITLIVLALLVGGCNIVGPLYVLAKGPPTKEAEHVLADVKTVVYVDDPDNRILSNPAVVRRDLGDRIAQDLMVSSYHVKKPPISPANMISSGSAITIADQHDKAGKLLPMDEIARMCGADQLIYVKVRSFAMTPDGATPRPIASVEVKVLDVSSRARVYPSGDVPRILQAQLREVDPAAFQTRSSRMEVSRALAQETGKQVGQLFYKHEPKQLGGNLNAR